MRAVFLDFGTVSSGDLDTRSLERVAPGIVLHAQTTAADVPARIAGFEAVFANKSVISRAMIEANPGLRLIALTATLCNILQSLCGSIGFILVMTSHL